MTIAEATLVNDDVLNLDSLLTAEELELRARVRAFVTERIRPNISAWYEQAHFPLELVPELGELGVLGMHLEGYGCPGRSAVEYGLAAMELEAGDSGLRTFVSVQGSLAMSAIHKWGSEEQKNEHLPAMARGEKIGCFGLTEPTAGSDPSSMATFAGARRPRRLDHQRRKALDRLGVCGPDCRYLGQHQPRCPRVHRADRHSRVHRDADRVQAVHAGFDPVRHRP